MIGADPLDRGTRREGLGKLHGRRRLRLQHAFHSIANFPDPSSQGNFLLGKSVNAPNSHRYTSADKTCVHLLPNGGRITPAEQQVLAAAVKFVACRRVRGVPNFPDPTTAGRGVGFSINPRVTGIDPHSQKFQAAQRICQPLMLGGGP